MKLRFWHFPAFLLAVAIFLPLSSCAYFGGPIDGRVLDEVSGKPIAGAIVVATWRGTAFSFVESPTVCIHVETATTDSAGRYHIRFWHAKTEPFGVRGVEATVTAYKQGYQLPEHINPGGLRGGDQLLRSFSGSREERFKAIRIAGVQCPNAGDSRRNLLPLYRAIYEQLSVLAVSKEERYFANAYMNAIEEITLPEAEAEGRNIERMEKIQNEDR